MPLNKIELGVTGVITAGNIRRFREARHLGYAELSRLLDDRGRKIAPLGLRRIEAGERRVDADDIIALALVLDVTPSALLLPTKPGRLTEKDDVLPAELIWKWALGLRPLSGDPIAFLRDCNPLRYIEVADVIGITDNATFDLTTEKETNK